MTNTGSGIFQLIGKFIAYKWIARHRNGHGIHSPFVYDLCRKAIFSKENTREQQALRRFHRSLYKSKEMLHIEDYGAGSRVTTTKERSVGSIARKSSLRPKHAAMLFRISKWYEPSLMMEFGSGLGISTRYLQASAECDLISMEGAEAKLRFARNLICGESTENSKQSTENSKQSAENRKQSVENSGESTESNEHCAVGNGGDRMIEFRGGRFDEHLEDLQHLFKERTLVFVDGNHSYEATKRYVNNFLEREDVEECLLILDDIYWSEGMEQAWMELSEDPRVAISIDLFQFGLLFRRSGIEKQHFRINF